MDQDGDFSSYASARWGVLVRSAIVLGCSLDAYVYRVLLNCHRDSRRRHWWGERPTDTLPDHDTADPTGQVDVTDAVRRALDNLSKVNREVVVLRYYAHLSEQQTAEILGIAPGTVKSRLSRALTQRAANTHLSGLLEGHTSD